MKPNLCCQINPVCDCKHCGFSLCKDCHEALKSDSIYFGSPMNKVADVHYDYSKCFGIAREITDEPTAAWEIEEKRKMFYDQQKKVSSLPN